MAASAGKKGATSLSFFMEAFWLSTQTWAEGVLGRQSGVQNKKKHG